MLDSPWNKRCAVTRENKCIMMMMQKKFSHEEDALHVILNEIIDEI